MDSGDRWGMSGASLTPKRSDDTLNVGQFEGGVFVERNTADLPEHETSDSKLTTLEGGLHRGSVLNFVELEQRQLLHSQIARRRDLVRLANNPVHLKVSDTSSRLRSCCGACDDREPSSSMNFDTLKWKPSEETWSRTYLGCCQCPFCCLCCCIRCGRKQIYRTG